MTTFNIQIDTDQLNIIQSSLIASLRLQKGLTAQQINDTLDLLDMWVALPQSEKASPKVTHGLCF